MASGYILHSVLVQGRLAFAMRRAAAARGHELGLQIMTPSLLAARLAGGLLRPASRESIEIGIRTALMQPGLLENIAAISDLPGTTRASFYFYNTTAEIDRMIDILREAARFFG